MFRNLREITFRLTNVIPKRIIFVSRGITVYTTELGYNVMIGSEYSVSSYLTVVLTDQYNVMANGGELIGTKE